MTLLNVKTTFSFILDMIYADHSNPKLINCAAFYLMYRCMFIVENVFILLQQEI